MKSFKTTYDRPVYTGLKFSAASKVQPQFARDTDINVMIQRALGGDPSVFARGGQRFDATNVPEDFHEAMNTLARGDTAWEELPLPVRQSYGTKEAFLKAVDDESRRQALAIEEARKASEVFVKKDVVTPTGVEASMPKSAPTT